MQRKGSLPIQSWTGGEYVSCRAGDVRPGDRLLLPIGTGDDTEQVEVGDHGVRIRCCSGVTTLDPEQAVQVWRPKPVAPPDRDEWEAAKADAGRLLRAIAP